MVVRADLAFSSPGAFSLGPHQYAGAGIGVVATTPVWDTGKREGGTCESERGRARLALVIAGTDSNGIDAAMRLVRVHGCVHSTRSVVSFEHCLVT